MSKGLKALERIIGCSTIESHTKKWQQDYLIVEKELKALEIIRSKKVLTHIIMGVENLKEYNRYAGGYMVLKEKEFKLLKEVLL